MAFSKFSRANCFSFFLFLFFFHFSASFSLFGVSSKERTVANPFLPVFRSFNSGVLSITPQLDVIFLTIVELHVYQELSEKILLHFREVGEGEVAGRVSNGSSRTCLLPFEISFFFDFCGVD